MAHQKYWQHLEELNASEEELKLTQNEFSTELPLLDEVNEHAGIGSASRRDFLKLMGFSVSAAVLASCELKVRKAIPYVFKPEEITPGVANYYASTIFDGTNYSSVLVKTREGRPIKIEGNSLSPITKGGTSAIAQATVLGLYDNARIKGPKIKGWNGDPEDFGWNVLDKEVIKKLKQSSTAGKKIVMLTSTVISPSTKKLFKEFASEYTGTEWVSYDAISYDGMLNANQQNFGKRAIPDYRIDKAKVIVGFDADFLGTWLFPEYFIPQYAANRKLRGENPEMSRHYQFESMMSLTGGNADIRVPLKPSAVAQSLMSLHDVIAGKSGGNKIGAGVASAEIEKAANELLENKGRSVVLCGINDPELQEVTNSINQMLGNYGNTIDMSRTINIHQGDSEKVSQLIKDMEAGNVGVLMTYQCNPAYDLPDAVAFANAMGKVDMTISFAWKPNETHQLSNIWAPGNHILESWDDAEAISGQYSITQPTIRRIYHTRQMQDSLLTWMSKETASTAAIPSASANDTTAVDTGAMMVDTLPVVKSDSGQKKLYTDTISPAEIDTYKYLYYDYLQSNWKQRATDSSFTTFRAFWDKCVHDGIYSKGQTASNIDNQEENLIEGAASGSFSYTPSTNSGRAVSSYQDMEGMELVVYAKVAISNGEYADNPWLQEMPDPMSRASWGNYLLISHTDAEARGIEKGDLLKVEANGYAITLPAIVQPGQAAGTVAVALGYGRTYGGKVKEDWIKIGENAYPYLKGNKGNFIVKGAKVDVAGGTERIGMVQMHGIIGSENNLKDRTIIKEGVLPNLSDLKGHIKEMRAEFKELNSESLYPGHQNEYSRGHHWKMAIDLNSCVGCGACTVACMAENNVPVVGREEIDRGHDMHWLRIDRYYSGDKLDNPDVVFQPMLCQHCDNAPCENVCPVSATNHSTEGLNQMAYNRCIGTRYCANNCPYKVRRFNWFDFLGADSFPANIHDPFDMSSDLTRMVLNPDVTVRGRGVMEKCSFCVQRIQSGKLEAKKAGTRLADGVIKTACQSACPANAIVFGDNNDENSELNKWLADGRTYYVIEEINTDPGVGYLAKVRNRTLEEELERKGYALSQEAHHTEEHTEETEH